jgi:hypothetical protein
MIGKELLKLRASESTLIKQLHISRTEHASL